MGLINRSVDNASRFSTLHKLRHWLFRLCQSRSGQCLEQKSLNNP
jgi:hypothetical protein